MANADEYTPPATRPTPMGVAKPGVPKTLGILNVIFGVLLILIGFCTIGGLAIAPTIMKGAEKITKDAQSKVEEQQKAQVKQYDDRIAEAKTDDEKKQIETEKANVVASQPKMVPIDMSIAEDTFKDPMIMSVTYAGAITGLLLHILLLVSGIGLIRLTPWGRTLGVWWGPLQIVQVLVLLVVSLIYVLPAVQANNEKMFANIDAQAKAKGGGGPADASAVQMGKAMSAIQIPMMIGQSLAGCIYPVVLLILLSTPGARAACLSRKPMNLDDL
jgi:hypothetical protein